MNKFTIDKNDNGYHIHGLPYHYFGKVIVPLYQTCRYYDECIKWLDKNYLDNYKVVKID